MDSIKEREKATQFCGAEDKQLGRECAASWVSGYCFYREIAGVCVIRRGELGLMCPWGARSRISSKEE